MKKILLMCFSLGFALSVIAQDRVVTGKVTSKEDGSPLPGVNIVIKGSYIWYSNQMQTVRIQSMLCKAPRSRSHLSDSKTVDYEVGDKTVVDAVLDSDVSQLSEVVVTAVGFSKRKKLSRLFCGVCQPKQAQQVSEPDPLRALQGKVSGVNIIGSSGVAGSATRITIRGNNSLLGNNQPLFVVDGVPFNNDTQATSNQLIGGGAYSSGISGLDPNTIGCPWRANRVGSSSTL